MSEKTTLEVGDRIRIHNDFSTLIVEIGRVTKTQAISKPYNDAGAVKKYKRNLHFGLPQIINPPKWTTTTHSLLT